MIPRGRKVITPAEIAHRAGVSLSTWRRRDAPNFHQRVKSLVQGRYLVYDLEQTLAYLDGQPIQALPAGEHPDDLLDDREVAALLGVATSTVSAYRTQGYLPKGTHPKDATGEDIASIRVTPRHQVEARRASLPEGHTPGKRGRPVGSAARDETEKLLASGQALSGRDVNAALRVSVGHGNRLLRAAGRAAGRGRRHDVQATDRQERIARVRTLLEQTEKTPTLQQIAEEVGVSKTEAHRLVQAVRGDSPMTSKDPDGWSAMPRPSPHRQCP
ncbi:hypothetical protein LHJ74_13260 [Streptomyces sp. N2-109]|uniref:HTH iclR-type domain-containing protein n=1 Tax=Streptomyces gossypii TaxID=2883101 RepID=A0ABT2JSQ7_9ACTN|nr:hypothetical protein [Streptomyces gossypii]MCT2590866.1 hypothetical protein [Streptomyces gossypii]